jgi:hypothetical protein
VPFLEKIISFKLILLVQSLGAGCTFEEGAKKTKCQKMNVNLFRNKLG